jgi:Prokaryotic homologs of the JAB domain
LAKGSEMSIRLTEHHFARLGHHLPPVDESLLHDIVLALNGTFVRGRRPGLEVCMPIAFALRKRRGLRPIFPYAQRGYPKVPARFLERMLNISRQRCEQQPMEALFHLSFTTELMLVQEGAKILDFHEGWHLEYPAQRSRADHVRPVYQGKGSSEERAVIEVHSHPYDKASFSTKDDEDEGGLSFRVYAIIGSVFDQPTIRVRVGMFGYFLEYQASEFFELPAELTDSVAEEQETV